MKRIIVFAIVTFAYAPVFSQAKRATVHSNVSTRNELRGSGLPDMPKKDDQVFYEKIDSGFKKEKEDVYKSAKTWFAESFRNSNFVLKMDDKGLGELIGKGTTTVSYTYGGTESNFSVRFTLKISCRKNKFRAQLYDLGIKEKDDNDYRAIEFYLTRSDDESAVMLRKTDEEIASILAAMDRSIAGKSDDF